jgi:hypothetical protein
MRMLVNPGGGAGSVPAPRASAAHVSALKDVVRSVYGLGVDAPVLVQQLACAEPGCAPLETVVAAFGPPRRSWRFPEPTVDVSPSELRAAIVDYPEGHRHADHD